jgi:hypothetical protein
MTGRVVIAGCGPAAHRLTEPAPGPATRVNLTLSRRPAGRPGRTFFGSGPDSSIKPLVLEVAR